MRRTVIAAFVVLALAGTGAVQAAETSTNVEIAVEEDGDSVWTVTNTVELTDDDERDGFDRIAESDERTAEMGENVAAPFGRFADRAAGETGREMSVEVVSVEAVRNGDEGVVTVEISWGDFASVDGTAVRVDDVFEGGLSLEEGQVLTVRAPEGYVVSEHEAHEADVDEESVTWTGPVEIEEDVWVVFDLSEEESDDGEGLPGFTFVAALLAVSLVAYRLR